MSGGGGGGGWPTIRSSTHLPRSTGEVRVPSAVTFRMLACVSTPPRWLVAGSFDLAQLAAADAGDPVVLGEPLDSGTSSPNGRTRSGCGRGESTSSKNSSVSRGIDQNRKSSNSP